VLTCGAGSIRSRTIRCREGRHPPPGCAIVDPRSTPPRDAPGWWARCSSIRRHRRSCSRTFSTTSAFGQAGLAGELTALGSDATLGRFLEEAGVSLTELYANNRRSFTALRQIAFGGPGARRGRAAAPRPVILFGTPQNARVWLNAPNPDLDKARPIELVKKRKPEVVAALPEDALLGHPS
jgi:hypothetical protein